MILLEADGVSHSFGDHLANDAVSLKIKQGEIHALLGENGAGKSTFVKMLYGVLGPDAGQFRWRGEPIAIASPKQARSLGIAMVFQHFSLFPALTVLENIAVALETGESLKQLRARLTREEEKYGLGIDPDRPVGGLSVGEKQRVEILRCLLQDPDLLILDEPTSVLTPQESERLFGVLERLAADGCAILYISHKLDEVVRLAGTATVLRGGRNAGSVSPKKSSTGKLAEMMVGGRVEQVERRRGADEKQAGKPLLSVRGLDRPAGHDFAVPLSGIGFHLRAGEILGIAGVSGNGQTELAEVLGGEWRCPVAERIQLGGRSIGQLGPSRRRALGLEYLPEERNGHAAVPEMTLSENTLLTRYQHYRGRRPVWARALLDPADAGGEQARIVAESDVRAPGEDPRAGQLSGGNLQKFILGRMLLAAPKVAVVVQPTWGVDIGAATAVRRRLLELAGAGCGIVLISQDLDEILALSANIAVLHRGRLSRPAPAGTMTAESIGLLMGGEEAA